MWYSFLADVVVGLHLGYVSFVLIGQVLILLGWVAGWGWVRNLWFRATHLAMILVVAIEAIFGITCPMTNWEYELNHLANRSAEQRSFIGQWMNNVLFYDLPDDDWRFLAAYLGFAGVVLLTFFLAPPRLNGHRAGTVAAVVLGIVGALFCVPNSPADPPRRLEPRWIGLVLLGAAVVCYAWGRRARPTAPASPPAGADPIGTQEPFPRRE